MLSVFAATEHKAVLESLVCNTVVDIGANRGQFALVSRSCYPQAKIYSFEPLDAPRDLLNRIFKHDKNFKAIDCALGETEGESDFHISKRDDSSSLLKISAKQSEYFPGTEQAEQITTRVQQLDKVMEQAQVPQPVLLKIDVQGGELAVLKGGVRFLDKVSYVYVEASFIELYEGQALAHQVIDFLQQNNFKLDGVYNVSYDKYGKAIQADFMFTKSN